MNEHGQVCRVRAMPEGQHSDTTYLLGVNRGSCVM